MCAEGIEVIMGVYYRPLLYNYVYWFVFMCTAIWCFVYIHSTQHQGPAMQFQRLRVVKCVKASKKAVYAWMFFSYWRLLYLYPHANTAHALMHTCIHMCTHTTTHVHLNPHITHHPHNSHLACTHYIFRVWHNIYSILHVHAYISMCHCIVTCVILVRASGRKWRFDQWVCWRHPVHLWPHRTTPCPLSAS